MKIGKTASAQICESMSGLVGAAAREMAEFLSARFEISVARVYAISREVRPRRKLRQDKDRPAHGIPEDVLVLADSWMLDQGFRAERTLRHLEANGLIAPGTISAATLRREVERRAGGSGLRDLRKLIKRKEKPIRPFQNTHRRMEAEYPLQVVAIDFTVLGQFYVDDDDNLGYLSPFAHRKNKPNPKGRMGWVYRAVDLHTRCRFTRVYSAMDTTCFLDFFYRLVEDKPNFPFCGVMEYIRSDGDSRIGSKLTTAMREKLGGIQLQQGIANPNFNGMVERSFYTTQDIENATRLHKMSLDDLNLMFQADDFFYNTRIHSTTKEAPFSRMLRNLNKVRLLPEREIFDALMSDEFMPRIDSYLCFRLGGQVYQLPDLPPFNQMARHQVRMKWNRRDADRVTISWRGRDYETPVGPQVIVPAVGDHPHVPKKNQQERFLEAAVAAREKVQDLDTFHYLIAESEKMFHLDRREREVIEIAAPAEPLLGMAEAVEAVKNLVNPFGYLPTGWGEILRERFADGATRAQINEAAEEIKRLGPAVSDVAD